MSRASPAPNDTPAFAPTGFEVEPAGRWEWTLLALGVALRLLLQFPLHRYPDDGDCVMTAIQGLEVLRGDPAVFVPTGFRLVAVNAYVTAASYALFGVGRTALAAGVFAVASLQMLLWWLATRELVGSRRARIALPFIVLPAPAVLQWGLHLPDDNPEIFLVSTAALWLGARIHRRGGGAAAFLAFGLVAGVALWASMLTLAVTLPTALWLARTRRAARRLSVLAAAAAGALAGASPWLAFNLRYAWPSFRANVVTQAVGDGASLGKSLENLWSERIVHLFTGANGLAQPAMPPFPRQLLWFAAVVLAIGVFAFAIAALLASWRGRRSEVERDVLALLFSILGFLLALNLVSRMATLNSLFISVRYLLPAALVFPPLFALAWSRLGSRGRGLAATLAAATLLFHATAPCWPWTAARESSSERLAESERLARELVAAGVDAVFGSHWIVYPLILDSDFTLIASPSGPNDVLRQRERPLPSPARWAIVDLSVRMPVAARRLGRPAREEGTYAAVILDEGVGPADRADGPELDAWEAILAGGRARDGKRVSP
jgi:hypothetical protein